ncbi:MAG: pyridoxal 5'-phosphate synthase glutaminase subunit PdxT [bacterium]|nr:pyridoxal 5'-phosphate synthase glutaminase subunit PdxT [bacterium]
MIANPKVGILAFQGDFAKHHQAFGRLKCDVRLVKSIGQLEACDYLVIPGGESSVIDRFIKSTNLAEAIKNFAAKRPVWGTCAGMILLAKNVVNDKVITPLDLLDITVERNGYGRQFESFIDFGEVMLGPKPESLEMVFIRAPRLSNIGPDVLSLGSCRNETVIVRQGNVVATSFHPEMTSSTRFQQYFLSIGK